jgi:hypothetical protein
MENHWRHRSSKLRWLLFSGIFGLFFLGDVFKNFTYEKGEVKPFSETKTFFKGTDQEVEVYSQSGREAGPTVLIFAGIHGDESGGYLTADRYVGLKLLKGNLIVVPRLNLYAILTGRRTGLSGGDMNRKFQLSEENTDLDDKVVSIAKSLMDRADVILNLHAGHGFYSPVWIDSTRNPIRWGQSNIIDVPIYHLPDGRRLELEHFAREVVKAINSEIVDGGFHFHVNNTDTSSKTSSYKEQRGSMTYYALTKKHKMAFGIDVTRNCSLPQAVSYLTLTVNAMLKKAGVILEAFPSASLGVIANELERNEEFSGVRVKINDLETVIPPKGEILLALGDKFQILSIETRHPRGWYPSLPSFNIYNGIGKEFSMRQKDRLILQKDGRRVAVFNIRVKENIPFGLEAGI